MTPPKKAKKPKTAMMQQKAKKAKKPKPLKVGGGTAITAAEVTAAPLPDWDNLNPAGFARPPDYRWSIARRLAAGAFTPPGWADPWVELALRVLTAPPDGVHGHADLEAAAAARDLAATNWPRVAVETRLLAGESVDEVAAKEGLTPAVVTAYEALHFAVVDQLSAAGYIAHFVIGLNGPRHYDPRTHVRALGYSGGPFVADAVLAAFTGPPLGPDTPPEVRRLHRRLRLLVAYACIPLRPRDYGKHARFYFLSLEHERRVGRRRGVGGATQEV